MYFCALLLPEWTLNITRRKEKVLRGCRVLSTTGEAEIFFHKNIFNNCCSSEFKNKFKIFQLAILIEFFRLKSSDFLLGRWPKNVPANSRMGNYGLWNFFIRDCYDWNHCCRWIIYSRSGREFNHSVVRIQIQFTRI